MSNPFRHRKYAEPLYPAATNTQPPQGQYQPIPEQPAQEERPGRGWHDVFSIVLVFLSALVLALLLIAYVFQSYQVSGISMQNTLHNNDHLIVWKVPRTIARITGHPYIPDRGDIIVFNEPGLMAYGSSDKQLIKRVIGLPGDHLVIKDDKVTIYNQQHPQGFTLKENFDGPRGSSTTTGNIDITLKKNQIFVMGDNRPDSLDSRIFGPVDVNNIIGKLVVRVLPISNFKIF